VNKLPDNLSAQTDAQAITIILTGVLTNALQYRKEVNPSVTLSATTSTEDHSTTIHVADNGAGIPDADKPKIFGKLFRASNARNISPDGSGLNLYMARSALTYLGGSITLESTEGIGTTVNITLPMAESTTDQPVHPSK
jgi:signal transduction histidine kinase